MSVRGTIKSGVNFIETLEELIGTPPVPFDLSHYGVYGAVDSPGYDGGLDDVDTVYMNVLDLTGTEVDLDLRNLTDALGRTLQFAIVRYMKVVLLGTNNLDVLLIGPHPTTDGWDSGPVTAAGGLAIRASTSRNQGKFEWGAPNTTGGTTAAGNKVLRFDPVARTFQVAVLLAGVSL
jgi:hypothetical protein